MKTINCILIGESNVGKTSFLILNKTNSFPGEYVPTLCDDCQLNVSLNGNDVALKFVDTCKGGIIDPLCKDVDVFLFCYSIGYQKSYDKIKNYWYQYIRKYIKRRPIILIGMKSDLREKNSDQNNLIPICKGIELKNEINAIEYIECSSIQHKNLDEVISACVNASLNKEQKTQCIIL